MKSTILALGLKQIGRFEPNSYLFCSLTIFLAAVAFDWVLFPYGLHFAVSKLVTLEEGSSVRDVWVKLPQNLTFSVYLFNITNPNQVENGAIPVVNEVGPYVYQEIREKVDLADDLDEDTVTFSGKTTWYFDGDKSHPLTGKEVVTVPHLPLLAVLLMAEIEFPAVVLGGVNAAMPDIYGSPASLFMRVTARQIMFDGVPLDCSSRSPLARTVCAVIKRNSKSLQIVAPNKYKFSIFGIRNGTAEPSRMTVKRGRDDSSMVGRLVMVDGQTSSRVWPEQGLCNKFRGTDSTIFPPFRKPNNTSVVAYSTELCRSLSGVFEKEDSYKGIKGFKYVLVLADPSEPSQQCYCRNIGKCYKRGTAELNDCLGAPLVASLPHFYAADETYSRGVIGLTPDKEKHETSLLLEPTSGTPLQIRKRLQGNIHIHPVRFVNLTGRLTPTLVPIFWAEESFDLGDELMGMLEWPLLLTLRAAEGGKWAALGASAALGLIGLSARRLRHRQLATAPLPSNSRPPNKTTEPTLEPNNSSSDK